MEHTKHIVRAVLLVVLACIVFVVIRHFAIPESFGDFGHYRAGSVADFRAQQPVHGDAGTCTDCHDHDEEAEAISAGQHSAVSCEVCHAPLATHVRDDEKIADMRADPSNTLCGWCHQQLAAPPSEFPQVVFRDHVSEKGLEMSPAVCLECHDAHNPSE
ncbi:MAG: cytochrome C [Planctomycetota bacterium]